MTRAKGLHALRVAAATIILVAALIAPATVGAEQGEPTSSDLTSTRATVGKWVATQQILFNERRAWQQEKDLLAARVELVRREATDLEMRLALVEEQIRAAGEKQGAVRRENDALKGTAAGLGETVARFEAAVRRLRPTLPAPLQEKMAPLYQRMPEGEGIGRVSVAERFQNVLGILNEINRMNSEITVASEIRALSDGRPSEVRAIYLGLAQAYFISAGGEAGIGRPAADGWAWQASPDLAPRINEVIDILAGTSSPRFVPLPIDIR